MKKKFLFLYVIAILLSCNINSSDEENLIVYNSIKLDPEQDSLFLSANGETRQFNLNGSIINVSEKTMRNSGVLAEAKYIVRQIDTSFQSVDASKAIWKSSNSAIATVSNGLVKATSINTTSGTTIITAQIGNTVSKTMIVNVRSVDTAPGLSLNPPDVALVFENKIDVSGVVQKNAKLSIVEPNSGFSNPNMSIGADGSFNTTVTGLNQGYRTITATATHPTNVNLKTTRSKVVIYYAYNFGADSIVGNWLGTTLGKDFNFTISKSILFTRYDIKGKLDVQFGVIGIVRDIELIGVVNNNGTIDATLSQTYEGITISGKFKGRFKTVGTAYGEYSAKAEKSGQPTLSAETTMTAVKIP